MKHVFTDFKRMAMVLSLMATLSLPAQNTENYLLRIKPRIAISDATFDFSGNNSHSAAQLQPVIEYYDIRQEESPLKRPLEQSNSGAEWQMGQGHTQSFAQDPTHGTPGSATNPRYIQWTPSGLKVNAQFPLKLWIEKATDADGGIFRVFKNRNGQTELQSSTLSGHQLMTYYIYDEMERLRAVIPPLAADYLCALVGQTIPYG